MTSGYVYPTIAVGSYNRSGVDFQKLPIGNPDEKTFTLVASNSTAIRWINIIGINNGIRTGKHRMEFDLVLNSGSISSKFAWNYSDSDDDPDTGNGYGIKQFPTVGHNSFDFEIFNDGVHPNPHVYFEIKAGSTFDISVTNFKVTHNYEEITVNRTAPVITSDRKGASRPLLSKLVGGASGAYSLRDLNDKAGNNKVVEVRRSSGGSRKFLAKEVSNGTLEAWVGAGNDGFVSIWYDQSGNDNDAIQPINWLQPKIVIAGSLVKDTRNNPALYFEGDSMDITDGLATSGAYSCIAYHETDFSTMLLRGESNAPRVRAANNGYQVVSFPPEVNPTFAVPSTKGLVSVIKDSSHNARVYADGVESSSGQKNVGSGDSPFKKLVTNYGNGGANGKMVELIYYPSDQSANRPAIEANINNQYDI